MNERHLFRGKRDDGEWVTGDLVLGKYPVFKGLKEPLILNDEGVWEVDPATIGQCTGLRDKNGKAGFEYDVVAYNGTHHRVYGAIRFGEIPSDHIKHIGFYIEWQNDGANMWGEWWRNDLAYWLADDKCEIIGNTTDNPEMVKEGNE